MVLVVRRLYGSDWSLSTTSLSVTASATYATFTVDSVDDTEYEANEDIVVEIDSTTCGGASSSDYSHTYTISSADSKPTATLSVSSSSVYEHGSDLTLTCTISHKSYQAGVCNLQKYSGTATEGTDFATLQI